MGMTSHEDRFARLLRWYPKQWRTRHGDVALSTMLDAADGEGRDTPTAAESWAAAAHGLGMRLDLRLARWCSWGALLISAALSVVLIGFLSQTYDALGQDIAAWAIPVSMATAAPTLLTVAIVSLLRHVGAMTAPHALGALVAGLTAIAFAALEGAAFSIGFDAADAGVPAGWFGDNWLTFLAGGIVFAAAAVAVPLYALMSSGRLHPALAVGLSFVCGLLIAPLLAGFTATPYACAFGAVALLLACLVTQRRGRRAKARQA
ncbi:hypothetical protein [Microbacterium sp. JB110]|uniref:hypothetical protein n=1 Tax=unclassified Microbacterium TaxID=2609290 RepID=UPI00097F1DDC|nr:hypothetical protein [Microbacterium sp. JB110]RCS57226.1 hypothetical protein CIK77_16400 [Microbacterium sp. JB110]SJM59210.1 Glycoprotein gp2 [Frigoribacterium sp. JB110]